MDHSIDYRRFALASVALIAALSQGCAWFLLGGAGFAVYTVSGGDDAQSNRTPYAQASAPSRTVGSPATITYKLFDPDSDSCSVEVRYSTDGATWHAATAASGSPGVTNLASGPDGIEYTFLWDWTADLGTSLFTGVRASVTPVDGKGLSGAPAETAAFVLGNSAPSVALNPIADAVTGIILVVLTLTDATSDAADLSVQYSTDGTTYHDCDIVIGTLVSAVSAPGGAQHTLAWDSEADGIAQDGTETSVTIRVTPTDEHGLAGAAETTPAFRIGNVKPSAQIVYDDWGMHANPVSIEYMLVDPESDMCSLTVEYSVDGGRTWGLATLSGLSNPATALSSSPSGESHAFTWNFAADQIDVGAAPNMRVFLRLTPGDAYNALGSRRLVQFALGYGFASWEESIASRYSWPYTSEKSPSLAFDAQDRLHVAWYSTLNTPAQLMHTVRGQDGQWSANSVVPTPGMAVSDPRLSGTSNSKINMVWVEATATASDVYFKFYENGAWDASNVNVSNSGAVASTAPAVASDASGFAHVVWVEAGSPDRLMYATNASGSWTAPADITPLAETASVLAPGVAIDSSGGIHVVYANGTGVYSISNTGSGFGTTAALVSGSDAGTIQKASITVDQSGVRTVVYVLDADLRFSRFDQSWSPPSTAASFPRPLIHCHAHAGQDGVVHAITVQSGMSTGYTEYLRYEGGAWSIPKSPQTSREGVGVVAQVRTDSYGVPHCVWSFEKNWMTPTSGPEGGVLLNSTDQRWTGFLDIAVAGAGETLVGADIASGQSFRQHAVFASIATNPGVMYLLFDGIWQEQVKVNGTSTEIPEDPVIAVTSADVPHVLWVESLAGTKRVFHAAMAASGFTTPAAVSTSDGDSADPDVASDAAGNLHAVWVMDGSGLRSVYYSRLSASSGTWSAPAVVSQTDGFCSSPSIAVDAAGGLHLAYSRHTGSAAASEIYYVSNTAGSWAAPDLRSGSTYLEAVEPDLFATGSGSGLVLDLAWSADGDVADRIGWHSEYSGGSWGLAQKTTPDDNATDIWSSPQILRDAHGNVHIAVFVDYGGSVYLYFFDLKSGYWIQCGQEDSGAAAGDFECIADSGGRLQYLFANGVDTVAWKHRR